MKNLFYFFKFSLRKKPLINKILTSFILVLLLPQYSCNTTEPPSNTTLTLKLEDVSCTEAWIKLTSANIQLPAAITLKQTNQTGDTKTQILNLNTQDSLLYIDSLLPNQTYKILAAMQQPDPVGYNNASNEISVTTLDTTSHNFTFETFTFGGTAGSSALYDVAIINENNIWAVGEIKIADTSINGYTTYNAVHWDGQNWELKRINMQSSCNPVTYPPLKAIWAFSENNIAVTSGGSIGWFDGNTNRADCGIRSILTGSINKLWGRSSSDLYAVGNNGNIAHYNGQSWIKLESGTDLDFYDIEGSYKTNNELEIYAIAASIGKSTEKRIVKLNNNLTENLLTSGIPSSIMGIWFKPDVKYYVVGSGMFLKTNISSNNPWESFWEGITQYYTTSVDGNELNDIVVCGSYGELLHFNGSSWKSYQDELQLQAGSYGEVKMKDNIIVAVGHNSPEAVITTGRRK
jgi:hypothetical protein